MTIGRRKEIWCHLLELFSSRSVKTKARLEEKHLRAAKVPCWRQCFRTYRTKQVFFFYKIKLRCSVAFQDGGASRGFIGCACSRPNFLDFFFPGSQVSKLPSSLSPPAYPPLLSFPDPCSVGDSSPDSS